MTRVPGLAPVGRRSGWPPSVTAPTAVRFHPSAEPDSGSARKLLALAASGQSRVFLQASLHGCADPDNDIDSRTMVASVRIAARRGRSCARLVPRGGCKPMTARTLTARLGPRSRPARPRRRSLPAARDLRATTRAQKIPQLRHHRPGPAARAPDGLAARLTSSSHPTSSSDRPARGRRPPANERHRPGRRHHRPRLPRRRLRVGPDPRRRSRSRSPSTWQAWPGAEARRQASRFTRSRSGSSTAARASSTTSLGTVTTPRQVPGHGQRDRLDAILTAGLRSNSLPEKAYLVRPHPAGGPDQILSIDW